MKRTYETPMALAEEFAPNEYVSACYKLACQRGPQDNLAGGWHWATGERGQVSHSAAGTADTCADPTANRIITSDGGMFNSIGENNGEQGWLNANLDYIDQKDGNSTIDPGDVIFWNTVSANGDRKWNHWGVVQQEDPNHPNHS